jgi:hypothetical protein
MTDREAFFALFKSKFLQGHMSDSLKEDMAFAYTEGWKAHAEHIAKQEPVLPNFLYGYDDAFDDFNEVPLEFDEVIKEYWSELRINEGGTFVMAGALSLGKCTLKVVNNELIMVDCENKYYTSPQPSVPDLDDLVPPSDIKLRGVYDANATDNSAVIATLQARLDKAREALEKLSDNCEFKQYLTYDYPTINSELLARQRFARKALNELSQEKGE